MGISIQTTMTHFCISKIKGTTGKSQLSKCCDPQHFTSKSQPTSHLNQQNIQTKFTLCSHNRLNAPIFS